MAIWRGARTRQGGQVQVEQEDFPRSVLKEEVGAWILRLGKAGLSRAVIEHQCAQQQMEGGIARWKAIHVGVEQAGQEVKAPPRKCAETAMVPTGDKRKHRNEGERQIIWEGYQKQFIRVGRTGVA